MKTSIPIFTPLPRAEPQCAAHAFGRPLDLPGRPATDLRHLNQEQLARRWGISPRTLERWRWLHQGPRYLKIGGRVVYRLEDIEAFEGMQMHGAEQPARQQG